MAAGQPYASVEEPFVTLTVEFELETDGRWIAEIPELPGVMVYGATRDEALANVQALALHTLADRIEHGEADASTLLSVSFTASQAA
jgi:predicted RNase H-like HicB family nuclease